MRSVLAVSGDVRSPSRTRGLVAALAGTVAARLGSTARVLDVGSEGLPLLVAPTRAQLSGAGRELVAEIESADVLVVGTPAARTSYRGAFRHLLDLVHPRSLAGTPVPLAFTGGNPLDGLVAEHRLRSLGGPSAALILPTAVHASADDFVGYTVASRAVLERIERAADEAAALLDVAREWRARAAAVPVAAVA